MWQVGIGSKQHFGWPRRAKRGRPITHEWIDLWTLLLPGQHRWAPQVSRTSSGRLGADKTKGSRGLSHSRLLSFARPTVGAWQMIGGDCGVSLPTAQQLGAAANFGDRTHCQIWGPNVNNTVFPLTHNRCEVVISWWSPLLPKISIYATKCESILEKSGIFIHLQSKYCINLSCKKNLTISWVQIAVRW